MDLDCHYTPVGIRSYTQEPHSCILRLNHRDSPEHCIHQYLNQEMVLIPGRIPLKPIIVQEFLAIIIKC